MRLRFPALAAAAFFCCLAAHADTFTVYAVDADTSDGGHLNGTFSIDRTSLVGSSVLLTYQGPNAFGGMPHTVSGGFEFATVTGQYSFIQFSGSDPVLLGLSGPFNAFTGLCTDYSNSACGGQSSRITLATGQSSTFTNGTLALAAATAPEPSSLALLGTGAIGMLGVARRRFLRG